VYFGTLLTRGKLNAFESVELSQLVISQNKKHLLDNWFKVGRAANVCNPAVVAGQDCETVLGALSSIPVFVPGS